MKRFLTVLVVLMLAAAVVGYAATTLTTRVIISVTASLSNPLDLVTASAPMSESLKLDFASGTGASQADKIWSDTRSLATAATEDLDLNGGGLTDAFGVAFAPAKVRLIMISSDAANTTNLTLFGDVLSLPVLNTAATTVTLQPGGVFLATWPALAGIVVGAGATDIVQISNAAGATATYSIVVIGTSA